VSEELLTLPEAAAPCGLSAAPPRRYAWTGKLKAIHKGRDWLVTRGDLAAMLGARDNRT
jgi:hypothetical protein